MKSLWLIPLGFVCWSALAVWIGYGLGERRGFRRWKADATRAYDIGVQHGRREERACQGIDPLLDDGEEWKRGGR